MARVNLTEYDPSWAERFASEAEQIAGALGDLVVEIEHVGSTAVPGLAAKPTIDIAVGATTLALPPDAVARLEALGFEDAAAASRPDEHRFRKGSGFPREVIVHILEWGGPGWRDYLRFRDALRADRALADEYEILKRRLVEERGDWYRGEDKAGLIECVLAAAPECRVFRSASPEETEGIAGRLAAELRPGDVVTVAGELGSGKTTFVRGACRALGVDGPVTSPTYTIGHRYRGTVDVSHLDLYRFESVSPAEWGDLEPYFDGAVCFVEWPEAAGDSLPPPRVRAGLRHAGEGHRQLSLESEEMSLLERAFTDADPRL